MDHEAGVAIFLALVVPVALGLAWLALSLLRRTLNERRERRSRAK